MPFAAGMSIEALKIAGAAIAVIAVIAPAGDHIPRGS
jgi:hypothetical protein